MKNRNSVLKRLSGIFKHNIVFKSSLTLKTLAIMTLAVFIVSVSVVPGFAQNNNTNPFKGISDQITYSIQDLKPLLNQNNIVVFAVSSDSHLHLLPETASQKHYQGLAGYVEFWNKLEHTFKNIVYVHNGDYFAGNSIFNENTNLMTQIFEKYPYSIYVPGNHDFDMQGIMEQVFSNLKKDGKINETKAEISLNNIKQTGMTILSSNLNRLDEAGIGYRSYIVLNAYNTKIGLIGQHMNGPGSGGGNALDNVIDAKTNLITSLKKLKDQGIKYAIIFTHQSPFDTRQAWDDSSVYGVIRNLPEEYKNMIVGVFLGHRHGLKAGKIDGIPFIEVGLYYRNVLVAQLALNENERPTISYKFYDLGNIELTSDAAKKAKKMVHEEIAEGFDEPLGVYIDNPIHLKPVEGSIVSESAELMADVVRTQIIKRIKTAEEPELAEIRGHEEDVIVAMSRYNSGRSDWETGPLTHAQLALRFPYPERASIVKATGAEISEFIKRNIIFDKENPTKPVANFLYSDNILVRYDDKNPNNIKVKVFIKNKNGHFSKIRKRKDYYFISLNHMLRGFFEASNTLDMKLYERVIFSFENIYHMMEDYFNSLSKESSRKAHISPRKDNIISKNNTEDKVIEDTTIKGVNKYEKLAPTF